MPVDPCAPYFIWIREKTFRATGVIRRHIHRVWHRIHRHAGNPHKVHHAGKSAAYGLRRKLIIPACAAATSLLPSDVAGLSQTTLADFSTPVQLAQVEPFQGIGFASSNGPFFTGGSLPSGVYLSPGLPLGEPEPHGIPPGLYAAPPFEGGSSPPLPSIPVGRAASPGILEPSSIFLLCSFALFLCCARLLVWLDFQKRRHVS